jgi:DNA-binding NtrC family response regulator
VTPVESTLARPLQLFVRPGVVTLEDGRSIEVGPDPIVVGRDGSCALVVDDREVSSVHLELCAVTEGVRLRDLGSTNGVVVGSVRVRDATLVGPSTVTIGQTRLEFTPKPKERLDVGFLSRFGGLVGVSPRMRRTFQTLAKVAATDLAILVTGETGTGKELAASALHQESPRRDGPFVVVDCGSIPANLAESILFGHEKGSFTGAGERRRGALSEADGGTLFLDELGELPVDLQPKLLRALSERQVRRIGSSSVETIDVRVVAATRRDLGQEMNAGRFRSDLFFRIAQVRVELPPLRERLEDVGPLVDVICDRLGRADRAAVVKQWIAEHMGRHDWPGNVRELVNVVSVASALADDPAAIDDVLTLTRVDRKEPPDSSGGTTQYGQARQQAIRHFEHGYFSELSRSCGGNISEMARRAGMERHHVRAFLRKHGLAARGGPA